MSEKAKELSSPVQDAWANTPSPPRNSNRATPISPPIATPSLARDSNRVTPISPPRSAGHFDAEEAEVDENILPDQEGIEILAQQSSENTSSSRSLQYVQSSPRDSALDPSLDDDEVGTGTSDDHRDPLPTNSKDTTSTEHHLQTPQLLPAPQTSPVKRMSPLSEQKHEVEVQVEDAQPPVLIEDVCSASSSSSKAESAESYVINNAKGGLGRMGPPAPAQETRETFSTTTPLHPVRSPVFTPPPKKRVAPGGSSSLDESPSAGSPTLLIAPQPIASPTRRPTFRPISMPAPPQPPPSTSALSSMALSQGSFYKADDLDLESDVSGGISTVRSVVEGVEDGDCPPQPQARNIGVAVVSPPPPTTLATPTLTAEEASEGSEMIASSPDVSPKLSNANTATTTRPTKKKATSEPPRAGANSVLADGSLENFKMVRGALVRRDLLVQEKDSSGVKQGGVTIEVVTGEAGSVEYIHCPAAQNVAEQRAAGADATVVAAVNSGVSLRGLEYGASVDFSAGMTAGAGGVDRSEKKSWDEEQQALEGENHAKSHQSQRPSVTFELQSLGRVVAPGEEGADTPVASAGKKLFAKSPAVKAAGGPPSFLSARQTAPASLFPKRSPMFGANVAPVKMKKVRNSTGGENGNAPTSVDNGAKGNIKSADVVATSSAASRTSHRYYTSGASMSSAVSAASSRAKMIAQSASPITPRVPWASVSSTLNSSSPSAEDTPRPLDTQNDGGTSLHRMKAYDQNRRKSSGSNISVVLVSAASSTSVRGPGAGSHQKARALPAPSVANRAPGQGSTKRGPPSRNGKGSRAGYHDEVAPPSLLLLPSPEPSGVGQQQSPRALQRGPGGILPGGTPTGIAEETANTSSGKHESKYQHLRKRVQAQQNLDHVVKKTSSENSAVSRTSSVASSASALMSPVSSGPRKLSGLAQAENPTSFFPGSSDENGFSLLVLNGREWRWLCLLLVFVYTALFYGVEPAKTKPVPFTAESKNASAAANSDSKVLHSHEEVKEELVPPGEQRQIISSAAPSSSSGEDEQEFGTHLSTSTTSTSSTTKTLSTSSTTSARARPPPRAAKTSQKELWKNATIRRSLTQSTKKKSKKRTSTSAMWMGSAGTGRKERPGVEVLEQVSAREDEVADENSKVEKPTTLGHVRDEDEDDAAQSRASTTLDRDHEEVSPTASSWTSWSLGLGASAVSVLGIFGAAFTRGGDNTLL
mmetsp:Transcript_5042/g.12720  ORF Transcript_5042/g.12720 Transcript_5042/m.12720 type:complete len:1214 (-) Transcript_5042:787-4428(-)|eukprot:CAMPEP_0178987288 /NCGR_PEP_ID=MMETSP0795-20121207/3180_1 /TAXON_ID=88552 /ORGANISM="Amoebophrya sp., Strain Ameob2" /LENGTH=1213 /DNA_ID=CAMNT_0020678451 /DNA_START=241 /DNA_END=3882 /DNA_ORIENTATION=+